MNKFWVLLLFLLVSFTSIAGPTKDGGPALIIIDMQPYFVERGGNHKTSENKKKVRNIINEQLQAIEMAKKAGIPIVLVEYEDSGPTNKKLKDAVKDYKRKKYITKDTDGMFNRWNKYKKDIDTYLEEEKVETLIITGANGGACVESSIEGALKEGYNVVAFSKGIADFNYRNFIYPYKDYYQKWEKEKCKDCKFKEVDELFEVLMTLALETEKKDDGKEINDSARDDGSGSKKLKSNSGPRSKTIRTRLK